MIMKTIKEKELQSELNDVYMRLSADAYACMQPYEALSASTTKYINVQYVSKM